MDRTITCITPTGDRSIPFELCKRWILSQTIKPDQWVVVDDGKTPLIPTAEMDYIRRSPTINDPQHTLLLNLQAGLEVVKGDYIIFIEDDEYYASNYIEEMIKKLSEYEVVGIGCSKYYNLPMAKYTKYDNMNLASLAQTAIRRSLLPKFLEILDGDTYIDVRFWESINGQGHIFDDADQMLYVGMKGLPGRAGIGIGHHDNHMYVQDSDRMILKKWIPNDYQYYLSLLEAT